MIFGDDEKNEPTEEEKKIGDGVGDGTEEQAE